MINGPNFLPVFCRGSSCCQNSEQFIHIPYAWLWHIFARWNFITLPLLIRTQFNGINHNMRWLGQTFCWPYSIFSCSNNQTRVFIGFVCFYSGLLIQSRYLHSPEQLFMIKTEIITHSLNNFLTDLLYWLNFMNRNVIHWGNWLSVMHEGIKSFYLL